MQTIIGKVKTLNRYPVKSFSGESLTETKIERYGLYGDRCYAFLDEKSPVKYLTAKHVPSLIEYKANLINKENNKAFPYVKITSPKGKLYSWEDDDFFHDIKQLSNRPLERVKFSPEDNMMAVDQANILLVTKPSLDALKQEWGKDMSYLRFRPNIVLSIDDNIPFLENEWMDKHIQINDTVLKIYKQCKRCKMVNIDPEKYDIDPTLLKTLAQHHNVNFGVYASVIKTGTIQLEDDVYLFADQ
ncbi:MOSC domain-containing protein [Lentibacillus halophilus]|uniref:MOSC domain-containing protein n=1 Tax=Lentibacillus halophilus TaxID=295065 RepID=A0ABN0Z358_9BACI